ncbi:hypothetical protein ONS95_003918 [Cadophora gregata]|uniref:uncharacterized protein n=1 Tax=Cadophora gregata TaxID=51156 RepID=UPI0026DD833F|nr:uncharacterized protein ONS95_003918 [Cadophora gregata]KAK0107216.1 hypothetical protein ONS95_003918 [Cadophora gregata]KAK0116899.1 hypothetical protein ONS96_012744 [Cadophora gregata f. sp. sojae]
MEDDEDAAEVEPYTTITPILLSKAKQDAYKHSDDEIARARALCEDMLFEDEHAGLQLQVMKWQVQRWLWNTLFPHEEDRFPGTKPRNLPVVKKENAPKGLGVKIRKTPRSKEEKDNEGDEKPIVAATNVLSISAESPHLCVTCGSYSHEEHACTSKVLHERVLECLVVGHGMYIFGKTAGCPKCLESV